MAWASFSAVHCRFPSGKRGLKFVQLVDFQEVVESLSSREAWIEIVL